MSLAAVDLSYAVARLRYAQSLPLSPDGPWMVDAWDFRCRELAARLLDTSGPLLLF